MQTGESQSGWLLPEVESISRPNHYDSGLACVDRGLRVPNGEGTFPAREIFQILPSISLLQIYHFINWKSVLAPNRSATLTGSPASGQLVKMLDGPAVPPPAGMISNLDNPSNIDTICYLTFSLCVGFASLAVVIRIYFKHLLIRSIAYEDCGC